MNDELRERLRRLPDHELFELYDKHRDEYTEEAAAMMQEELQSRGIDAAAKTAGAVKQEADQGRRYRREDFMPLAHQFSRVDIMLAQLILREHAIAFFVELPAPASSVLPIEADVMQRYTVHVPREDFERAGGIIEEHFCAAGGTYRRKELGTKDRLRSFCFHEAPMSEREAAEEVGVRFSEEERRRIVSCIDRAIADADALEQRLERGIFYYDNLEPLRGRLSASDAATLTKEDLLTILEVLQIFCDEDGFGRELETVAADILGFFSA